MFAQSRWFADMEVGMTVLDVFSSDVVSIVSGEGTIGKLEIMAKSISGFKEIASL